MCVCIRGSVHMFVQMCMSICVCARLCMGVCEVSSCADEFECVLRLRCRAQWTSEGIMDAIFQHDRAEKWIVFVLLVE